MPQTPAEREARCARCGKRFLYRSIASHKPFPFCTTRCREIDLGNWLTEKYALPGEGRSEVENETEESADES